MIGLLRYSRSLLADSSSPETTVPDGEPAITSLSVKTIVATDNDDTDNDGWYGRASVVVRNGIVIMTYREGEAHPINTYGQVHIRFSDDYGETWSNEDQYLDGTPISGFPMWPTSTPFGTSDAGPVHGLLTLCPNGNLLCHMWSSSYNGGFNDGTWQGRSIDGGLTWSKSKVFYQSVPGGVNNNKLYSGEDRVVVGNDIYIGVRNYAVANPQQEENYIAKSSDNGNTWTIIGQVTTLTNPSPRGTQEIGLEYLGNGRFIAILREAANEDGHRSFSDDFCETWSAIEDVRVEFGLTATQGIGRTIVNTRSHLKGKDDWWEDPVVIVSGFALMSTPGSPQRRNCVWVSKDKGINWYGPFWLDTQAYDGGYGDIFYNPNKNEYVAVNYHSPNSHYDASVKQYNFKIEWS